MRAARFYGEGDMRVEEVDAPTPKAGEVLVEVGGCGICGSDLHIYEHPGDRHGPDDPGILGHEVGGTVVELGEDVDYELGTDVVINPHIACQECWCCQKGLYNLCRNLSPTAVRPGGFTEYVASPIGNLIPVPSGLSPSDAAVAQPLSVGQHAVQTSPVGLGDSVAVVGTGPIGLGAVRFAKSAGADPIYVSEPLDARREIAGDVGGDVLIDPTETDPVESIREATGAGVDVAFEAVGSERTINDAIKMARPEGHAKIIGVFGDEASIEPQDIVRHERTVSGSATHQLGPRVREEYDVTLTHLADGRLDVDNYVTSRIPLDDIIEEGFEKLLGGAEDEVKIVVEP